jgi:uncharacterized phage-like protein YoqJ
MMKEQVLIAITGHRDMLETERLKEEIDEYFEQLIARNQNKEIILLSPLAEGADRYVVEIFLEKQKKDKNLRLVVPLPFEEKQYAKEFNKASQKEFFKLLNQADGKFQIPSMGDPPYLELGKYLANICHVLLAVWDGTFNGKEGGTADVVAYGRNMNLEFKHIACSRNTT